MEGRGKGIGTWNGIESKGGKVRKVRGDGWMEVKGTEVREVKEVKEMKHCRAGLEMKASK